MFQILAEWSTDVLLGAWKYLMQLKSKKKSLTKISGRNRSEQSISSSAKGVSFYSIRKVAHISIFSVTRSADFSDKITELFDSPINRASTSKIFACFPFRSQRNHRSHFFTPSEFEDKCPAVSSAGKITETTLRLIIVTSYREISLVYR